MQRPSGRLSDDVKAPVKALQGRVSGALVVRSSGALLVCSSGALLVRSSGALQVPSSGAILGVVQTPLERRFGCATAAPLRRSSGTVRAPLQRHEGAVSGAVKGAAKGTIKCDTGASRVCALVRTGARFRRALCAAEGHQRHWRLFGRRAGGARCRQGLCALQARPPTPFLEGAWGATSEAVLLEANDWSQNMCSNGT